MSESPKKYDLQKNNQEEIPSPNNSFDYKSFKTNVELSWELSEDQEKIINLQIDGTNELLRSSDFFLYYIEKYREYRHEFFSTENLDRLSEEGPVERLALLMWASSYFTNTPTDFENYLNRFPTDIVTLDYFYSNKQGNPSGLRDSGWFSLIHPYLPSKENDPGFSREADIENHSKRRELAPNYLLEGYDYVTSQGTDLTRFGIATKYFQEVMDAIAEKERYMQPGRVDAEALFESEEYRAFSQEQKLDFLQSILGELQFHLVFNEVYNSGFTEEITRKVESKLTNNVREKEAVFYNGFHSVLYSRYQPLEIYESSKSDLLSDIDDPYLSNSSDVASIGFTQSILEEFVKLEPREEIADILVDFWKKNRNPFFINDVLKAIETHGVSRAVKKILETKEESIEKNAQQALLYRLEFGQLGISEQGVRYLEKMYDLGEYNNPNYHVSRLTPKGDVGVFDEEYELFKYFNLGDVLSEEDTIKPEVLDFTFETLFYAHENESEEERQEREQYAQEFKRHYYQISQNILFEKIGLKLNNLSFKEQGALILHFNEANEGDQERLVGFLSEYQETGVKIFSIVQTDKHLARALLYLHETLSQEQFTKLASYIAGITNKLGTLKSEIKAIFSESYENSAVSGATAGVVQRSQRVLLEIEKQPEKLEKLITSQKVDADVFSSVFKAASQDRNFSFEDMKDLSYAEESDFLEKTEIKELLNIQIANYDQEQIESVLDQVHKLSAQEIDQFKTALHEGLEGLLEDVPDNSKFKVLRLKGKPIAYIRIDEQINDNEEPSYYLGSFNVAPEYAGSSIGGLMEDSTMKVLRESGKDQEIHSMPGLRVSAHYVEKQDFVITDLELYKSTSVKLFTQKYLSDRRFYFKDASALDSSGVPIAPEGAEGYLVESRDSLEDFTMQDYERYLELGVISRLYRNKADNKWYICVEPAEGVTGTTDQDSLVMSQNHPEYSQAA